MQEIDMTIFDVSPNAMWLHDFSGVRKVFQQWKDNGVNDLREFLYEDRSRLLECLLTIGTWRVNDATLKLYEVENLEQIWQTFMKFVNPEVNDSQIEAFCDLWNGKTNYRLALESFTSTGRPIDVQVSGRIMAGYEDNWEMVLVITEEITDYQKARRLAESLFMHSPTALWVKDYSEIKKRFNRLKEEGVNNLAHYIAHHSQFVESCFQMIRSTQVNAALLKLFKVKNKEEFEASIFPLLCQKDNPNFCHQLLSLWEGLHDIEQEGHYKNYMGKELFLIEKFTIFPDSKHNWDTVQIAYTDLTERKKLEDHLQHLSEYDQLTQLHNRTFFNQEIIRLQEKKVFPISCIYIDINGLKKINDIQGHYHGDLHLQHFARIIKNVTQKMKCSVSRVGGDEFVVLMPYAREKQAMQLIEDIELAINKDVLSPNKISFSSGIATMEAHQSIESLITKADENMYDTKKNYYRMRSI